jgi:chromosome segregation protein
MDKEIRSIQLDLDKLLLNIDNANDNEDIDNMERNLQELNENYESIDNRISRLKEDLDEQPENERPLINKLNSISRDMEKFKKKIEEKNNKLDKLKRENKYFEGELEGVEKKKAEREIVLDQHKEIDNQGDLIDSIHQNVKAAGTNLHNMNNELEDQGQKMERIHETVLNTNEKIKQTGHVMTKIEWRNQCMKVTTLIAVIVVGLFDAVWVGYCLYRKFR